MACEPISDPALLPIRLTQWQPKLLLLDKSLLEELSAESLQALRTEFPSVHVLLLVDAVCSGAVELILRNRFHGYLPTIGPPHTYVKAIRAVIQGEIWLPRALLCKALSDLLRTPNAHAEGNAGLGGCVNTADTFTRRQRQVVQLLNQGLSNKEIARHLGIAEDTIKKHLQSIFSKLGVRRRTLVVLRQIASQV